MNDNNEILESLYNKTLNLSIVTNYGETTCQKTFNVELNFINIDCKIGSFSANFYFRTPYGIKYKKYSSLKRMFRSIQKTAKKYNIDCLYFIITDDFLCDYTDLLNPGYCYEFIKIWSTDLNEVSEISEIKK